MTPSSCPSCGGVTAGAALSGLCAGCLLHAASTGSSGTGDCAIEAGSTIGPYEIVSRLGRGGMGQVYLGWDARLCRTVAIKVLASPFTADSDRTRRLEREARIVAGLNHPRICTVHELGCEEGLTYIVMEHLEGETLADRLAGGALPLAEVLKLGAEIADGLDRAHRQGITHRDLKPANIMLTRSGAKLLDFGLAARVYATERSATPVVSADSVSSLGGTIQYMAPEQLEGKGADIRSDVFSFGLVLHEMLTGQPAFGGEQGDRLIAAVVAANPIPATALRPDVPSSLDRLIRRCLRKDPEERWQSLRDVQFELTTLAEESARRPERLRPAPAGRRRKPWTAISRIAAVLMASVIGALTVPAVASHRPPASHAIRFAASTPRPVSDLAGSSGMAFVSPDGLSLVWMSASDGKTVLAVQAFDATEPTMLAGTDEARWPFWSPDSRTIAFFARGELRTIPASGGPIATIARAPFGMGGSWSARGTILFAPDRTGALLEVPDRGGEPKPVTTIDAAREETSHQWPAFLPDGRHFVYFAWSDQVEHRGLYAADLDAHERRWIGPADGGAVWAAPGHLLFTRDGMLVAQRFDASLGRLLDTPHVVQQHVCGSGTIVPPCFSASATGVLVYHVARLFRHQLAWFTRSGRQLDIPIEPGSYSSPMLSADGSRVVMDRHDPRTWQLGVWLFDLDRRVLSRVLDETPHAMGALWSPDGRALAFSTDSADRHEIYTVNVQGGVPRSLFRAPKLVLLTDWSRDRRRLLFQTRGEGNQDDVWVLPLDPGQAAFPYLRTRFSERQARFSPDGRWVAYCSDESGRPEVYVQPLPSTGAKWQISNDGGHEPSWRRDGRELFYLSSDRRLMAVPVRLAADVTVGAASELFRVPRDAPFDSRISYAPAADGQRFLVNVAAPDRVRLPMFETRVVVNWPATLQDR
jgi:serine/threonine protein kinase/Tol biopolymer transport system component